MLLARGYRRGNPLFEGWVCSSCLQKSTNKKRRALSSPVKASHNAQFIHTARENALIDQSSSKGGFPNAGSSRQDEPLRQAHLPSGAARTRFAPSPTGYMHLGGLRTALFSYLLAKRTGGQFVLRIEDTDQKRLVPDAELRLCEDLAWAGLPWDEGPLVGGPFGPYKQSERNSIYQKYAKELLGRGSAYRCFCTSQTAGAGSQSYVTSGCYQDCASLQVDQAEEKASQQAFTIRLKPPENMHKQVYTDLIYGKIKRLKRTPTAGPATDENEAGDTADTILMKSDGTPTYHFANVVDDHLMKITHVIRGTEWMASTPLHVDLYRAFGWEPPSFAHVGLLLDKDKAKLSKRNADLVLDVQSLREHQGVLPEALCNFLALLGWSNPGKNDVLDMAQLVQEFDLKFTKGNTIVTMDKLWYLQKHHVQQRCERARATDSRKPIEGIVFRTMKAVEARFGPDQALVGSSQTLPGHCTNILFADDKTYTTPERYVERNRYFFAFDPLDVPEVGPFHTEVNAQGHKPPMDIDRFIRRLTGNEFGPPRRDETLAKDFEEPLFPSPAAAVEQLHAMAARPPTRVEREAAKIHAAINHMIWYTVLYPDLDFPGSAQYQAKTYAVNHDHLPFTNQPIDVAAYAKHFVDQDSSSRNEPKEEPNALEKRYKDWQRAVMRYLRAKLAYGLPGPSMGIVMAILGQEEYCRRLGVKVTVDQGMRLMPK